MNKREVSPWGLAIAFGGLFVVSVGVGLLIEYSSTPFPFVKSMWEDRWQRIDNERTAGF